ncbi:putative membrane protein [Kribbella orskensis]|uniref:Membrane protein n=1 Tax=Kribbella orskensis TaxID=2512216 RepID=A0ABY2BTI3_9ACTN|nr:putative membrane protein [Kribbella sp. VKM Ac-2500]TCO27852.1 putative membrane protein [Kribbella orskensis]
MPGASGRYGSLVNTIAQIFVALAGVFHLAVFALESLLFKKPSTYQRFLIKTEAEAEAARPWAFNQGFYNLFLAIGAIGGLIAGGDKGHAIALFACACMAGAGIVLIASDRRLARSAALQAVPPILALVLAAVL